MPGARRASVWTISALPGHATLCGVAWEGEAPPMPRWLQAVLKDLAQFLRTMGPRRWPGQEF